MDYDVNNQQALQAGVYFQQTMKQQQDWRPISTAPRDGTIIEVRCTYGVAPWYGLFRWTNGVEKVTLQDGQTVEMHGQPRWAKVGQDNSSFSDDSSFSWRPYTGQVGSYVDPTGGMQDSPAYWRAAAATERGLPRDYFEKETQRNVDRAEGKVGFWSWLTDWFR